MSGFKRCSQMCVLALLLLAWLVLCGMQEGKDVQTLIIGYWAVLTIKNLIDWIGGKWMDRRELTPEAIKKLLNDMLACKGNAMAVDRSVVASTLDYILRLERRQLELLDKCEDKCALCRHAEEYSCNDDFDCDACPQTECKCRECLGTKDCTSFQWRENL